MASSFQPFNPRGELHKTRRHLPHWHQPGATYFVTFRLAGSLPREVVERFDELRRLNDDEAFAWMDRHLDAGVGSCPLAILANAEIVASSLRHFDGDRYSLGAFVVMPNHVHALVRPVDSVDLPSVVHGWKSFTARALQRAAGLVGSVWQPEAFDRIVRDGAELRRYHDYVLANPGVAKLRPGSFIAGQGSARWLD